jgi:uroporphyrinogen-III synthase
MPRVVLFKTPTTTNGTDAYEESFSRAGFGITYVPVLQETFHLDQLTRIILDRDSTWGGIVITSKRGAEAWTQAASICEEDHSSE